MKITAITVQTRNKNRVNVSVDGRYRFSLEIAQLVELGLKQGAEYTEEELIELEQESTYGKVYARALEYCFMRPRSAREVRDYLYRKTRPTRQKDGSLKPGIAPVITERVFDRLVAKGHINDERFAQYWVENRKLRQGTSRRSLQAELLKKGVERSIIDMVIADSSRDDTEEIDKIIAKRAQRYDDPQKLIAYLARQGFSYDTIQDALKRQQASDE